MPRSRSGCTRGSRRWTRRVIECAPALALRIGVWGALATVALPPSATHADAGEVAGCVWGPVADVGAVQRVLERWITAHGLPPLVQDRWDLSVEGARGQVTLELAAGSLTLAWALGKACEPTAIVIRPSGPYAGALPDETAVRALVADLAAITEKRYVDLRTRHPRSWQPRRPFALALGLALAVCLALLAWRQRAEKKSGQGWFGSRVRSLTKLDGLRLLGLLVIVALLPSAPLGSGSSGFSTWLHQNALVWMGILPLVSFLWLVATGAFGFGSPVRADWPALLIFLFALGIREGYAPPGLQELEIHFFYGTLPNRHSVVLPLLQMFLQPLARDPYRLMMHVGGVLGALATLPLYLFVRQRTGCSTAAGFAALFFAVHPIIVRIAPTDGPYSFLSCAWFAGLALWTAAELGAKELFAGAVLLGIAATCRAEGGLYLLASILLVDRRALWTAARRHPHAALLAGCVVAGLLAAQVIFCFPFHIRHGELLPRIGHFEWTDVLRAGLWSVDYNDPLLAVLVVTGALAGWVDRRFGLGLGAALATLVVVWPVSTSTGGSWILHRLVPTCALQTIAAGVGAAWAVRRIPRIGHRSAGWIPGLAAALYLFVAHRHEIRATHAVNDEFWMLRRHLAPEGEVKRECSLLSLGRTMDTDLHDFSQALPGMAYRRCDKEDCMGIAAAGGCQYYLRSLNCYFFDSIVPSECVERGRTPEGELWPCVDPRCAELERTLELEAVEERTVDLYAVFRNSTGRPQWPRTAEIGLYRVRGTRSP